MSNNRERVIITGDYNIKSPKWGMTDLRGQIIKEWMPTNNLILLKQDDKTIFEIYCIWTDFLSKHFEPRNRRNRVGILFEIA